MEKLKVMYQGKQDQLKLIDFFEQINQYVRTKDMPTNLYTHTDSPIDIGIIDFFNFDTHEIRNNTTDLCIAVIRNNKGYIINHLIIKPNTLLSVEYTIGQTAGENPYNYLALSFVIERL